MTPEQHRDIIRAGVAVRGWPKPRMMSRPWENSVYIVWTWPAHSTCPAMYRNIETGEIQEMHAGMMIHESADAEYISNVFANIDRDFERAGFNPATGTFYKGL